MTNGLVIEKFADADARNAKWAELRAAGRRHVIRYRGDTDGRFYVAYSREIKPALSPVQEVAVAAQAVAGGEEWRKDNPELMDAYQATQESRAHMAVEELESLPQ